LDLSARHSFGEEEKTALLHLCDQAIASGNTPGYNGPEEDAFGKEFAALLGGGGYADGVNSGTNALYVALRALNLPAYSEVAVSAVTDPGGMMPIAAVSCLPVPVDSMPAPTTSAQTSSKRASAPTPAPWSSPTSAASPRPCRPSWPSPGNTACQ
jgi:dTDP-4-amino-4,6-dideoxygalactose transaminase